MARTRASRRTKAEALGRVSTGRVQKSTASTSMQTRSSTRRASGGNNGSDPGKNNDNNPPSRYVHNGRNPKDQRCTRCIQHRKSCSGGRPCDLCRRANVAHLCIRADANFRRDSGAAPARSTAPAPATSVTNLPGPACSTRRTKAATPSPVASSPAAPSSVQMSPARGTETESPSPAPAPTTPASQSVNDDLFMQQSSSPERVTSSTAQALSPVAPPSPVLNVPGSTIFAPLGTGPDPYWVPIPFPTPSPPATTSRSRDNSPSPNITY